MKGFLCAFLISSFLGFSGLQSANAEATTPATGLDQAVRYLVGLVANSGRTFIRNDTEYDSRSAAEHMQTKYEYFRNRIEKPADFIDLAASKSLLTGKPYRVVLEDGSMVLTRDWLREALAGYCARRPGGDCH